MKRFSILLLSFLVFSVCIAADPPQKPKPTPPPPPPAPLYPSLPPNLMLPGGLTKPLAQVRDFLDKTEAAFKALGGGQPVVFDRSLLTPQLFMNISLARAQLLYYLDPSSMETAKSVYDLLRIDMGNQRFVPRDVIHPQYGAHLPYFNVLPEGSPKDLRLLKQPLTPAIRDVKDAKSTLRYMIEMLAAVNTADVRAQAALVMIARQKALTDKNIDAAFSRSMIDRGERARLIAALTPAIDPDFAAAASRPKAPQLIIPPRPESESFPRNPLNSGLGDGGYGTRFYTGMPDYLRPLQVSPGANFTPTYVQQPLITNPSSVFIPRIGTP